VQGVARLHLAAALACAAAVVAASRPASAQLVAAVDGGVVWDSDSPGSAVAADARFGVRFGLPRNWGVYRTVTSVLLGSMILQPEAIGGYRRVPAAFAAPSLGLGSAGDTIEVGRVGAGLRLGFAVLPTRPFEPLIFAHFGPAFGSGDFGSLLDMGAAIDWRFDWGSLGVQASFDSLSVRGGTLAWFEVGPHLDYHFLLW
jgi:hypothetical protein